MAVISILSFSALLNRYSKRKDFSFFFSKAFVLFYRVKKKIINKLDKESLKLTSLEILNHGKLHPVVVSATAQTKTITTNLHSSGIHGANSIALHFQKNLKQIRL